MKLARALAFIFVLLAPYSIVFAKLQSKPGNDTIQIPPVFPFATNQFCLKNTSGFDTVMSQNQDWHVSLTEDSLITIEYNKLGNQIIKLESNLYLLGITNNLDTVVVKAEIEPLGKAKIEVVRITKGSILQSPEVLEVGEKIRFRASWDLPDYAKPRARLRSYFTISVHSFGDKYQFIEGYPDMGGGTRSIDLSAYDSKNEVLFKLERIKHNFNIYQNGKYVALDTDNVSKKWWIRKAEDAAAKDSIRFERISEKVVGITVTGLFLTDGGCNTFEPAVRLAFIRDSLAYKTRVSYPQMDCGLSSTNVSRFKFYINTDDVQPIAYDSIKPSMYQFVLNDDNRKKTNRFSIPFFIAEWPEREVKYFPAVVELYQNIAKNGSYVLPNPRYPGLYPDISGIKLIAKPH